MSTKPGARGGGLFVPRSSEGITVSRVWWFLLREAQWGLVHSDIRG